MYEEQFADIYDNLCTAGLGKDYDREAAQLAALIRARKPDARTILDVACGTGAHLAALQPLFDEIAGVEPAAAMRAQAQAILPAVAIFDADMRDLRLDRTWNAVVCLFSSIGYATTVDELHATLAGLARHTTPGGVVVVEPWFTPDQWIDNKISHLVAETPARTIIRLGHSSRTGTISRMRMHYLIGDTKAAEPTAHFTDEHVMSLFTTDEYTNAFTVAGLADVQWVPGWSEGRDRIVATKPNPYQ